MPIQYKNGEEYYNKIYVFFNATVAITILPLGYLLLQKQSNQLLPVVTSYWVSWLLTGSLILAIGAGLFWAIRQYRLGLKAVKEQSSLRAILNSYYAVSTRKFLFLMLISGIAVAGYYVTVNALFIIAYVVTMIFLSLKRPTLNLLIEELNLSDDRKQVLIDKLEIE